MVMIRLARVGARKQPYYRIVVIEKDRARNGRSSGTVSSIGPEWARKCQRSWPSWSKTLRCRKLLQHDSISQIGMRL